VGQLLIIDRDYVEPSNLQRQSLFDEADAADPCPRPSPAARKIAAFTLRSMSKAEVADLTPENIHALLSEADLNSGRHDNLKPAISSRFAVKAAKPWIYAAAVAAYAVTMNIIPGETACLSCVFPLRRRARLKPLIRRDTQQRGNLVAPYRPRKQLRFLSALMTNCAGPCSPLTCGAMSKLKSRRPARAGCATLRLPPVSSPGGRTPPPDHALRQNSVQIHERQPAVGLHGNVCSLGAARQGQTPTTLWLKFWRDLTN